jgi:hypothetical protein
MSGSHRALFGEQLAGAPRPAPSMALLLGDYDAMDGKFRSAAVARSPRGRRGCAVPQRRTVTLGDWLEGGAGPLGASARR